jgi:hypothetical protein
MRRLSFFIKSCCALFKLLLGSGVPVSVGSRSVDSFGFELVVGVADSFGLELVVGVADSFRLELVVGVADSFRFEVVVGVAEVIVGVLVAVADLPLVRDPFAFAFDAPLPLAALTLGVAPLALAPDVVEGPAFATLTGLALAEVTRTVGCLALAFPPLAAAGAAPIDTANAAMTAVHASFE